MKMLNTQFSILHRRGGGDKGLPLYMYIFRDGDLYILYILYGLYIGYGHYIIYYIYYIYYIIYI